MRNFCIRPRALLCLLIALSTGCTDTVGPNERVSSVTVNPDTSVLTEIGETAGFAATGRDESGDVVSQATFTWRSSDPAVATVSNGTVTSGSEGEAAIIASVSGVSDSGVVVVDVPAEPPSQQPPGTRVVKGQVVLPEGSEVSPADLTAASFQSEHALNASGEYAVYVNESDHPSFVGTFSADGDPILLAAAFPDQGNTSDSGDRAWSTLLPSEIKTGAESTAEALVLSSPVFGGASAKDFQRARERLADSSRFQSLVTRIEAYLRSESEVEQGLFGQDVYPELAKEAEEVALAILGGGASSQAVSRDVGITDDDPTFSQNEAGELVLTNPDMAVRGANFTSIGEGSEQGFLVPRMSIDWVFGIPPLEMQDGRKTLGEIEGKHDVWVSSGFNGDDLLDAENLSPALWNVGLLFSQIVDLIGPDIEGLDELPQCFVTNIRNGGAGQFEGLLNDLIAIRDNGGLVGVTVSTFFQTLVDYALPCVPEIADTLLENAIPQLLKSAWGSAFKVLSAGELVQFTFDWMLEDAVTDSPLPDGLGGGYTQRYALLSGSNFHSSRGGALSVRWTPPEEGEFILDGDQMSVSGPPLREYDLEKGSHDWALRGDFWPETGSFEVKQAGWHTVDLDLLKITGLRVSPASASIAINQTQQFTATGIDDEGDPVSLPEDPTWTSSDPSVAEVDDSGLATARANGTTEIIAELQGAGSASSTLEVIDSEATPSASGGTGDFTTQSGDSGEMDLCVVVYDVDGEKITGLSASEYSIPDLSIGTGSLEFTAQSVDVRNCADRGPLSTALVVDQSGSMNSNDPSDARLASVKQFTRKMDKGDEAALFAFNNTVDQVTGFSSSRTGLDAAVASLSDPGGLTAMYDAGIEACSFVSANAKNSNRAIMLLSDGEDNQSSSSLSDLVSKCNSMDVRVYTVGFASSPPENLAVIAARTDGRAIYSQTVDIVLSAIRALPATIRGDICPDCVNFDVTASGYDLAQGGAVSGTVTADISSQIGESSTVVSFYNPTLDQINTVSAPFHVEWFAATSSSDITSVGITPRDLGASNRWAEDLPLTPSGMVGCLGDPSSHEASSCWPVRIPDRRPGTLSVPW